MRYLLFTLPLLVLGYLNYPALGSWLSTQYKYYQADLEESFVTVDNHQICYLRSKSRSGTPILLLHGFQSEKNTWLRYLPYLEGQEVILVDYPAHGRSDSYPQSFDVAALGQWVYRFCQALKLEKVHLVGSSMSGAVACHLSLQHPEFVKTLFLINPLGAKVKEESKLQTQGNEALVFPNTLEELDSFSTYFSGKPLEASLIVKRYVLDKLKARRPFYRQAFQELISSEPLNPSLRKIKVPTFIIASGQDAIIPPSSFEVFHKEIKGSRILRLEQAAHRLFGESFISTAKQLQNFVKENDAL